ncbi:leucyl aminopeptidase [Helicobacter sp. 13S00401-1]|uniref:leucyl aminopeptidase n=1 Tax=Helicobacter sp. 13S00401-1 TaxID=1905758 RepID=UPI000BA4F2ED|nr:leucyl aminopeptidase [Helicobacter sp. 13S00401-1]PAF49038.1 leucyl aminopeptidase [Helicobacter sp. 13S00401-1]
MVKLTNTKNEGVQLVLVTKTDIDNNASNIAADLELLKAFNFKAKGNFFSQKNKILYIGIKDFSVDSLESACLSALNVLTEWKIESAFIDIDDKFSATIAYAFLLGSYKFDRFKSKDPKESDSTDSRILSISIKNASPSLLDEVSLVSKEVCFVRDLVNTPPNIANSTYLAYVARDKSLEKEFKDKVTCNLYDNDFLESQKMGAFLAVNQASNFPAYLVHLVYKPKKAKKKVVLVGKGLVYDTGGLSLKPADYMTTMKADKAGACTVLGAFFAIAKLELDVELHAIMGITDNAIGKNAYRPDDVLVSREGKTIEVKNTDAEGRLVLADCLSYAQDLGADVILDFATLTGACVVALGEYTSGVMGFNDELKDSFVKASLEANELAHTLPFNPHLKKLLESKIADVSNISSSRYGGAITAGLFLSEFIREEYKEKWVHVDIAGPAYVEKTWSVNPSGASGIALRSIVHFVKNYIKG